MQYLDKLFQALIKFISKTFQSNYLQKQLLALLLTSLYVAEIEV